MLQARRSPAGSTPRHQSFSVVGGFRSGGIASWLFAGFAAVAVGCAAGQQAGVEQTGGTGTPGSGGSGGMTATGGTSPGSGGAVGTGGRATGATGGSVGSSGGTVGATGGSGTARGTGGSGPIGIAFPYMENFEDGVANGFVAGVDEERAPLGTWAVVADGGTQVYRQQTVTDDLTWAVGGAFQWTDQYLQTRVKIVSGAEDVLIAIAVRFSDFKSYYFLEIRNDAVKIRVRTPSTQSDLVSHSFGSAAALVDGTWYKFGLSVKGSTLVVYFNDMQVAMVTDAMLTAGGIGFGVRDGVVQFDDISVTAPP